MENKKTYIDLFAGCGGLSLGLFNSGKWKGAFAVEKSPFAFETLKFNLIKRLDHFDWPVWLEQKEHDINDVLKKHKSDLMSLRNHIDLVVGGPPCQGFSTAGQRDESDQRNKLIKSYIRFIRLVQPKIIFFENVKGFTQRFEKNKSKGKRYSEYVKRALERSGADYTGYDVCGKLIDFSEFGVPQKRTRFILVGFRKDTNIANKVSPEVFFNLITDNCEKFLDNKKIPKKNDVESAISDLLMDHGTIPCPDSNGFKSAVYGLANTKYQKHLRARKPRGTAPDSHRFANHKKETSALFAQLLNEAPKGIKLQGDNKIKFNIKKRSLTVLNEKLPAPTLTSHPDDYVHYSEPRILTVREYARIQTFPDNFKFREKYTTGGKLRKYEVPRYTQIGNAIPPLFGEQAGIALDVIVNA